MADVTISGLNSGTPNKDTAVIPYTDGFTTYKTSPSGIVAAAPGAVMQVQHYAYEVAEGFSNTASWNQFFTCSFTPRTSTSKLFIQSCFMCSGNGGIRLRRGNTELFHPWSTIPGYGPGQANADRPYWVWDYYSANVVQTLWNNGSQRGTASFNVMDASHNATGSVSYNYDVKCWTSSGMGFNESNAKYDGNPGAPSTVTIWEIAA